MKWIRTLLKAVQTILKTLFPKSRLANILYLVIGFILAQWEPLLELIEKLKEIL